MSNEKNVFMEKAKKELYEMEENILKLQKLIEENRDKIKNLVESSDDNYNHSMGVWSKAVEDWRAMMRFFSKS